MNWIGASIAALFFLQGAAWAAAEKEDLPGGHGREKYRYEAIPIGGEAGKKELTEITLIEADRGVEYISKTISPEDIEEITIHIGPGRQVHFRVEDHLQPSEREGSAGEGLDSRSQSIC